MSVSKAISDNAFAAKMSGLLNAPKGRQLVDELAYMAGRWADESDYEDFNEYVAFATKKVKEFGGKFIGLSKRPFKLTLQKDDCHIVLTISRGQVKYAAHGI